MKKNLFLLFAFLLTITSCEKDDKKGEDDKQKVVEVEAVSLDKKQLTLKAGESYQFKVTYTPVDTGIYASEWIINNYKPTHGTNEEKLTIKNGLLLSKESCTLDVLYAIMTNGGEVLSDTCKVEYLISDEEVYRKYCYGYLVKDTTGLSSETFTIFKPENYGSDTTYLVGFRKDKLWIGLFNVNTKKQIYEWTDTEPTSRTQKVHLRYDEYVEFTIKNTYVKSFIKRGEDLVFSLGLTDRWNPYSNDYSLLYFRKGGKIKKYFYTGPSYKPVKEWYENSYLMNIDVSQEPYDAVDNFYTCFSESGEVISSGKVYYGLKADWIPTSFDEFIYIDQLHEYTSTTDLHISKMSFKREYSIWYIELGIKVDHNDRYLMSVAKKNGDIWTLNIKITPLSGREYTLVYEVNIKDGKVVKRNN